MINIIFIVLFLISLIYALFFGNVKSINEAIGSAPIEAFKVFIEMTCIMIFWSGILEVCKKSGLLKTLTKGISFIIYPLFKPLKRDSKAMEYIAINFAANMVGVGSAATPFGLKAMQELNAENEYRKIASKEMITLIVINTSGLCIMPSTLVALRQAYGSKNPSYIIPFVIIVTFITTIFAISLNQVFKHYARD